MSKSYPYFRPLEGGGVLLVTHLDKTSKEAGITLNRTEGMALLFSLIDAMPPETKAEKLVNKKQHSRPRQTDAEQRAELGGKTVREMITSVLLAPHHPNCTCGSCARTKGIKPTFTVDLDNGRVTTTWEKA